MRQPLRILQVSTADVFGGAERIALDLHRSYREAGHDAMLAVGWKFGNEPGVMHMPNDEMRNNWAQQWGKLAPRIEGGGKHATLSGDQVVLRRVVKAIAEPARAWNIASGFDDYEFPATEWLVEQASDFDIVHLHNLHGGYFDLRRLPELCVAAPTIVTAHDMWLATGHCAYSVDCNRWKSGCGPCPHLGFPPPLLRDKAYENYLTKQSLYRQCATRLTLSSPSQWGLDTLNNSILAPAIYQSKMIANGIDTKTFRPRDKQLVRAELGLTPDARILTFSVTATTNPYKDTSTVVKSIARVASAHPDVHLVILGVAESMPRVKNVTVHTPGFLRNKAEVVRYLTASDIYIHAARAEMFGLALVEAQACGVPVVATDVGGIPETFIDGATGLLVPPSDPQAMADACMSLLADETLRERMAQAAAQHAVTNFSLEHMRDEYLSLYYSLG